MLSAASLFYTTQPSSLALSLAAREASARNSLGVIGASRSSGVQPDVATRAASRSSLSAGLADSLPLASMIAPCAVCRKHLYLPPR